MGSEFHKIYGAYLEVLGYTPTAPKRELSGASRLYKAGYTAEDVVSCYESIKSERWWRNKHVSLTQVAKDIGAWKQEHMSDKEASEWFKNNNPKM